MTYLEKFAQIFFPEINFVLNPLRQISDALMIMLYSSLIEIFSRLNASPVHTFP